MDCQISWLDGRDDALHGLAGRDAEVHHGAGALRHHVVFGASLEHGRRDGGAQERNMRAGTENVAGIIGLASALDISNSKTAENFTKILSLRQLFKSLLEAHFEDIRYNGPQNDGFLAHVLSVSFPASPKADMLVMNLDIAGICASSGSACSAGIEEDSHVLKAIGHPKDRKTIRFSFSPYNTEDEVRCAIENMKSMVATKNGG